MAKPHSPKTLAALLDRLGPAMRALEAGAPRHRLTAALEDGPQPMRALARSLGVAPQSLTPLVDALEAEGVVTRERHGADRRVTLIRLSDHARDAARAARDARHARLAALFEGVDKDDRAGFARTAEALLDALGAEAR